MNRFLVLLMICLATSAVFAGCHEPTPADDSDGTDGTDGGQDGGDDAAGNITLTVADAPDVVMANESFNVTINVDADGTVTTSHFGAHWSFNSTADREDLAPGDFDGASPHVTEQTDLGDSYTINDWSFGDDFAGQTIYFRAHVETEAGHFWSDEQTITIAPSA